MWYNSDSENPIVPESLKQYTTGIRYLSTKQVPSCLLLRTPGSSSVVKNRDILLRSGFTLREVTGKPGEEPRDLTVRRLTEGLQSPVGTLAEILEESASLADMAHQNDDAMVDSDHESSGSESENIPEILEARIPGQKIRFRKDIRYRVKYDDPWKIHAGYRLADIRGKPSEIVVWSGDVIRLQDPLPARILGPNWQASQKSKVRFSAIADRNVKLHVIYNHTHWGHRLKELCNDSSSLYMNWSRKLRTRLNRFLSGSTDPSMPRPVVERLFESTRCNIKARSDRLLELLKTVDGIFLQRYLCYPEEVWTWERFDMFTLGNIATLLGDEFLDGEMTQEALSVKTSYAQLKQARKWFKDVSHRNNLEHALEDLSEIPHWCRQFAGVWRRASRLTGPRRLYVVGILSQTRGCGTPPPLVLLQSKVKFLTTISRSPPPDDATSRSIRRAALEEVLSKLPQEAFTGLATKSRVTVSTSSSWEATRREGGTIEAARMILQSLPIGEQVPVRDLDTGRIETYKSRENFDSTGEVVFWLSLDHVLRTPLVQLRSAYLTMVKEPGKARTVTKARAALKIVLDVVNGICSYPLKKGIESSHSGMAQANHGWNFFTNLYGPWRNLVFNPVSREKINNGPDSFLEEIEYAPLYVGFTDYSEATDRIEHKVARLAGDVWMTKCGIPKVLRGIVHETCYTPRKIFFDGTGPLKKIGSEISGETTRFITLRKGILMGDPLTKVVLHLLNIVSRRLGALTTDKSVVHALPNGGEPLVSRLRAFVQA